MRTLTRKIPLLAGVALALVACAGGGGSGPATTVVPPPPTVNQAPMIAGLGNRIVDQDGSAQIGFSVSDPESSPAELRLRVETSNSALFGADSLAVTGATAERVLTLRPTEDLAGRATVTVVATDPQGASSQQTFAVDVIAVPTSVVALTNDTFARDNLDTPQAVTGKTFPASVDDPTAFDTLLARP